MLHPRGLVPKLLGQWCHFRGDWWQVLLVSRIPTCFPARRWFNIALSCYFFQSHYRHESRLSESTSACLARSLAWCFCFRSACPYFDFDFGCLSTELPFHLKSMDILWKKVTQGKCGSSFLYCELCKIWILFSHMHWQKMIISLVASTFQVSRFADYITLQLWSLLLLITAKLIRYVCRFEAYYTY